MDKRGILFIFIIIIAICFIFHNSIPSKYTKLGESFSGFMNRSLVRFEYENSPLHTFVYGGTGTGKTYFIRQYLKLYLDPQVVTIHQAVTLIKTKTKTKTKAKPTAS